MKYYVLIIICFIMHMNSCTMFYHNESGGIIWDPIDSTLLDSVYVFESGSAKVVIFPSKYNVIFKLKEYQCRFTPTIELVKKADIEVCAQYKKANIAFIERQLDDSTVYGIPLTGIRRQKEYDDLLYWINKESSNIHKWHRQYIGYINQNGEHILHVQFINFSPDPHGFKKHIHQGWIFGWHGRLKKILEAWTIM